MKNLNNGLFNYNTTRNVGGIIIQYDGTIKNAWSCSPDEEGKSVIPIIEKGGITELRIPKLNVYSLIVFREVVRPSKLPN